MEEIITEMTEVLSPEERVPEIEELVQIIDEKRFLEFKGIVESIPPKDVAELLENMPNKQCATAYRLLSKELAAEVFVGAILMIEL